MIFYHNPKKLKFNETEIEIVQEWITEMDVVMYSESGNALIHQLTPEMSEQILNS